MRACFIQLRASPTVRGGVDACSPARNHISQSPRVCSNYGLALDGYVSHEHLCPNTSQPILPHHWSITFSTMENILQWKENSYDLRFWFSLVSLTHLLFTSWLWYCCYSFFSRLQFHFVYFKFVFLFTWLFSHSLAISLDHLQFHFIILLLFIFQFV
jgi:hypothetical protein